MIKQINLLIIGFCVGLLVSLLVTDYLLAKHESKKYKEYNKIYLEKVSSLEYDLMNEKVEKEWYSRRLDECNIQKRSKELLK